MASAVGSSTLNMPLQVGPVTAERKAGRDGHRKALRRLWSRRSAALGPGRSRPRADVRHGATHARARPVRLSYADAMTRYFFDETDTHDQDGLEQPGLMPSHAFSEQAIHRAGRVFVPLRKSGQARPGRGRVFHAVTPHCRMSLCADEPGAGSAWAEPPGNEVTCRACLKRPMRFR